MGYDVEVASTTADDAETSPALMEAVMAFKDTLDAIHKILEHFFTPQYLLQSVGDDPYYPSREAFKANLADLIACRENLRGVLKSFGIQVYMKNLRMVYSDDFRDSLIGWFRHAKHLVEIVARRDRLFPEEQPLVDAAKDAYYECCALLQEFNALKAAHNDFFPGSGIPLVDASDL